MKDLAGKTAFVTGAASGIGFGIASALAQAGVKVMLCDIEEAALAKKQEMTETTNPIIEGLDLIVNVVRRTSEHGIGVHELLDGGLRVVDGVAFAVLHEPPFLGAGLQHRDVGTDRIVARRVGERLEHGRRGTHVAGDQIGTAQPLRAR